MIKPLADAIPNTQVASSPNRSSLLVRALVAYSIYEHGNEGGTASRVELSLAPRSCVVTDNGRGIGLHRDGYVTGLVEQLAVRKTEVALHGLGLAIISTSSPLMTIESRRNGRLRKQEFSWGIALREVSDEPWSGASGTRTTFSVADDAPDIDFGEVIAQIHHWKESHPGLQIDVSTDGAHVL